jgi:hypothetical protein
MRGSVPASIPDSHNVSAKIQTQSLNQIVLRYIHQQIKFYKLLYFALNFRQHVA